MARAVLHWEFPGIYTAAAVELGLAQAEDPVVVHRHDRVLDLAGLPELRRGQTLPAARRLAPQATFLPVETLGGAETYRAVWDQLLDVGPALEPTAWHAGYVDVTGCLPRRGVKTYLAGLSQRLQNLTLQPPSRGVGNSKLVARYASPRLQVVAPAEALGFLHDCRLRPDRGVTRKMIGLLGELGCHRWGEVAEVPEPRLRALFGVQGVVLHRWSNGVDPRPVQARYPPPTETITAPIEPDPEGRWIRIFESLAATLVGRLQRRGEQATEVLLALGGPGGWRTFRRRSARGVGGAARLQAMLQGLLPTDLDPEQIHEVRITLHGLRPVQAVQGVLFAEFEEERRQLLDEALSRVRRRYGLGSLGFGREAPPRERLAEQVWRLEGVLE